MPGTFRLTETVQFGGLVGPLTTGMVPLPINLDGEPLVKVPLTQPSQREPEMVRALTKMRAE